MSYRRSIVVISGPKEEEGEDELQQRYNDQLADMMVHTKFQESLANVTRELHTITEQIYIYQQPEVTQEVVVSVLPNILISLLNSRERARKMYRDALTSRIAEQEWDIEDLLLELRNELDRAEDLLTLYPRRGSMH
ncbi:hypothetical protein NCAS_0D03290 [Naumovozyma castellii]|uniref:Uncharacterized protein n=1 Tax=Naumovozyma castellii TaxID=27288 RepID=G0VEB9_NAUCA|nr:hypothetical protein NCAS_0D03290 [Naumovozyma castellii CBS 4309]CCC69910.1 hypothetical protein NCAS_0D03290 [Naumovozyma castellii CBS 4309]